MLTEQEIIELEFNDDIWVDIGRNVTSGVLDTLKFARAIESAVLAKIKAQGEVAWLHRQRTDSDVVTTAVKHVWGNVAVGSLAAYDIPLYKLPEGD